MKLEFVKGLTVSAGVGIPPAMLIQLESTVAGGRGAVGRLLRPRRDVYHVIVAGCEPTPTVVGISELDIQQ